MGANRAVVLQKAARSFSMLLLGYAAVAVVGSSAFVGLRAYQADEWRVHNSQARPMVEPERTQPLEQKPRGAPLSPAIVMAGDQIEVTIFEAAAGGLFIPHNAGTRTGNFVTIPMQELDSGGYISVPYAGKILALGRSTEDIQQDIVRAIANRAIDPQAIVSIIRK